MKLVKSKLFVFCFCILVLQNAVIAQRPLSFSNLTIENGLSQNSVIAITQDKAGFLWFGTRQGLNRYDGYQFKAYRNITGKAGSISANEIVCLLVDKKGVMWVGTTNGLNKYDQKNDAFIHIPLDPKHSKKETTIESIYEDGDNNIWIGSTEGLSLLTNRDKNIFTPFQFSLKDKPAFRNTVYSIFKDIRGTIWLGTNDGLIGISSKNGRYTYKRFNYDSRKENTISSNYITSINTDANGNLWIGTNNGLCRYDDGTESFQTFRRNNQDPNSLINNDIREILLDHNGLLWIGTQEGLSILDPRRMKFSNYQHEHEVKGSISHNSIHSIFQGVAKNIWVGTYFGGVNFSSPIATQFKVYQNNKLKPSISGNVISSIVEDENEGLWIGTEGAGLNYADFKRGYYRNYKTNPDDPNSISSNLIKIIINDKSRNGELIIGTHNGGLNIFNPLTGKFRRIVNVRNSRNIPGTAEIVALLQDNSGTLWVGSMNGLSVLKKENGAFPWRTSKSTLEKYLRKKGVTTLFEDHEKNLWIGTTEGLYRYNIHTKLLRSFFKNERDNNKLHSDFITCISESKEGKMLIGTYFGGISIYDPRTNHFKTFKEKDGLANDNVVGIVEDNNRKIWISTTNGLSELNPDSEKFRNYTKSDGLAGNEFNARSYFKSGWAELFFGGLNGLTSFLPEEIETNKYTAPIIFTGLKLFNQPVDVNGRDKLLKQQILNTEEITFKHDQNHFTLSFALLNYIKSDKNKYAYKLDDYDKDWTYTGNPAATYTNLPSGTYNFKVRGINNDGVPGSNEAHIAIKILPPIWASWWAYLIYTLVFSMILFLTIRYLFIQALLKRSEDVQKMKLNFFTYISHEIRTPLTLILGPLEHLLTTTKNNPEINKQVLPIKNNADRLMRLITELMDFRKAETGHLKLYVSRNNISEFTRDIFQAFQYLADANQIDYKLEIELKDSELYFDKVQLEKVLFNLLSNAFKFTSEQGIIKVSLEENAQDVIIKVRDNGKGIPYESQTKLFSDFFQVDEQGSGHIGSGIGLALSKSIVDSHQGSISITSSPATSDLAGDTCFTVRLKKGKGHFKGNDFIDTEHGQVDRSIYTPERPIQAISVTENDKKKNRDTILVVEDNPEIRNMLAMFLSNDYQIVESIDGLSGWDAATDLFPDLIICDVMMPVMDGLELCKKLKTDERTSHIPIILLTAKSSHINQMDGLETGADVYVTKPFNIDLLMLNIKNLLQSRQTMRKKFSKEVNLQPQNITVNTVEHAFMAKIVQYIEEHMSDEDFNVPELANHIGMSQPVLYKKIRAITDLSVNDFIKTIRLKKAAQLFVQKAYNVSEISYLVGFNDPKYFSREFRKQFGQSPKEFVAGMDNKE